MILSILFTVFSATTYASFSDVPSTHPNAVAVEWAQAKGIVSGYDDNTFKPDSTINRAEFVKILLGSKYDLYEIEYTDFLDNHDFTDVPANVWYEPYILFAWQKNIIDGYADKTFRASNTINLAEAAKIITNVQLEKPLEPMGTYWYEAYIQYLQNYNALPGNTDPSHLITRGEMVEIVYTMNLATTGNASTSLERIARINEVKLSFSYPDLWGDVKKSIINNDLLYYDFPSYTNSPIIKLINITDSEKEVCTLSDCRTVSTNDMMVEISSNPDVIIAGIPMKLIDYYSVEGGLFVRKYNFFRNDYEVSIFHFFDFPTELERRYYKDTSLWEAYTTMMGSDNTEDAINRVLQKFPDETVKLKKEVMLFEDVMSTIVLE